jgi:hypothetical protein
MSVRQNLPRSCPNDEPWPSGRTTVRQDFSGHTSAVSNFHIRLHVSEPWGRSVWTAKLQHAISIYDERVFGPRGADVQTVEVESSVTIYDAPASGPQLSDVRTVNFELRFLPYGDMGPDRIPHRSDG